MANWNGLQLTNKGIALQAKVQAGEELVITKLKLGSGIVSGGTDIKTLTDLIEPEQNLGIGAKEAVDDYCRISSTISNTGLEAGYYVRELGVFAQDPDVGEILYMYTTDGAPDYLPAGGGSTAISQEFSVMIAVNDTDNVSVVIDDDALATMGYVQLQIQQHNSDDEAHEAAFNAHNDDINAHTDKIASQTEAEAQSDQNNTKFMSPLRVYQAIVAYFTNFLAAAVFTGIVKAVAPNANSNDNSVPTTSWVRTCITSMMKNIAEILEIQWKAEATGYLLFGPYLGNIKILWGTYSFTSASGYNDFNITYTIPFTHIAVAPAIILARGNSGINGGFPTYTAENQTTAGFKARIVLNESNMLNSLYWFAIGA